MMELAHVLAARGSKLGRRQFASALSMQSREASVPK